MHKGTVIKVNANQRYATTAVTSLVLKELAKKHKIPIQVLCVMNKAVVALMLIHCFIGIRCS
jgi:aspartyl aminopeptidase